METISVHEARANLSQLLDRAANGEAFIIAKAGKPIARLVGCGEGRTREGGHWKGLIRIGPNCDAPLPDDINEVFREPS